MSVESEILTKKRQNRAIATLHCPQEEQTYGFKARPEGFEPLSSLFISIAYVPSWTIFGLFLCRVVRFQHDIGHPVQYALTAISGVMKPVGAA
ncbi:MAG: hypothetical protein PVI97_03205 [Candidatus Thiodiazotropha sp.]|jgi:hypothetical protein